LIVSNFQRSEKNSCTDSRIVGADRIRDDALVQADEDIMATKSTKEHGKIIIKAFIFQWIPWVSWPLIK
jgi:hypothetical protein